MVLRFLLNSAMNNISSSVVPFQIMNISSMNLRNSRALLLLKFKHSLQKKNI